MNRDELLQQGILRRALCVACLASGLFCTVSLSFAQTLLDQNVDFRYQVREPSEALTFSLPFDSSKSLVVKFGGYFTDSDGGIGNRLVSGAYNFMWLNLDGSSYHKSPEVRFGNSFGTQYIYLEESIPFTPSEVIFNFRGAVSSDRIIDGETRLAIPHNSQLFGWFQIEQVPEPNVIGFLVVAGWLAFKQGRPNH